MTVRAVTPQVHAIGGGLQIWRDLDGYDLAQDSRWDEVDPSGFYPDPKLSDSGAFPSRAGDRAAEPLGGGLAARSTLGPPGSGHNPPPPLPGTEPQDVSSARRAPGAA